MVVWYHFTAITAKAKENHFCGIYASDDSMFSHGSLTPPPGCIP
jgi:hypothetical protein